MLYSLIGLGLVFALIGFIVTEKNAKYILAGYNTMSEENQKKVDIKNYIPYFRKFHIFLGVSIFVIGWSLNQFIGSNVAGIFIVFYPILAYIYFVINSSKYSLGINPKKNKIAIFILIGCLIFISGLLSTSFKENKLEYNSNKIEIKGEYGESFTPTEIQSIELVDQLPEISIRTNGFSLGEVRKGYFKTKEGEKIKLMINAEHPPYLLFTKANGEKIYYSAKKDSNEIIFSELKKVLPSIHYQ